MANRKAKASAEALLWAWGGAAGLAVLVLALLLVLGGWNIIQAIWMAAVTFLLVGAFNYFVFARPVPPLAGNFDAQLRTGPQRNVATAPAARAPAAAMPAVGKKPVLLAAAEGEADDLKRIKGVGPALEKALNDMGVYHYRQIASWSPEEVAWADENLVEEFKGRVSRDDWVPQAKILAAGGETEFSRRQDADGEG